ncbi:MAG: AAA family ATPase [Myxococcales bacterium]|nr:AAA family ATPase [Myxococcales bacterium]
MTSRLALGSGWTLWRAIRFPDQRPVALKVWEQGLDATGYARFEDEVELGRLLQGVEAVVPSSMVTYEGRPALEFDDLAGTTLESLVRSPVPLELALDVAIALTHAVGQVHRRGVLLLSLKPRHLLVQAEAARVWILDLLSAKRVGPRGFIEAAPRFTEAALPFISPELTGRINRPIDARADLYGLGVLFFLLLTGKLPFTARDPAEWVHAHVALEPPDVRSLRPEVPLVLARIVAKLLEKEPDARYHSAAGLEFDLRRSRESALADRTIDWALGAQDVPDRLLLPSHLHGRGAQFGALTEAYERVRAEGRAELIVVAGAPGIGKTSLVNELRRPVASRRGLFGAGRSDRLWHEVPYASVAAALGELVSGVLTRDEAELEACRARIEAELGVTAGLAVRLVPSLGHLLGPTPEVPELPGAEAELRMRYMLRQLLRGFGRGAEPTVLVLDDLQWADFATLALLGDLARNPDLGRLLVVGTYRDTEVDEDHPLRRTLDQLAQDGLQVPTIHLPPLQVGDVAQLISEALKAPRADVQPIAEVIHGRARGNPLFVIELFVGLRGKKLLWFDQDQRRWRWDAAGIHSAATSDTVVELLVGRLRELSTEAQETLALAGCFGITVAAQRLAIALGRPAELALREPIDEGLIVSEHGALRFPHDRVQEAAYSLLPEAERPATHLRLGRRLLAATPEARWAEHCFELAGQLDAGAPLITDRPERERLARLNMLAADQARRASANRTALTYLVAADALLEDDRWSRLPELAFALDLKRAECELLTSDTTSAEVRLARLNERALSTQERTAVTCAQMQLFVITDRSGRAVETCLTFLREVGIEWSAHPSEADATSEYEALRRELEGVEIEGLLELPAASDPDVVAAMAVLTEALTPALFTDKYLFRMVVARMVLLSLRHGNCQGSSLGYLWLHHDLVERSGDYELGYRLGKLACDLVDKSGPDRFKPRVYQGFAFSIGPWTHHPGNGRDLTERSFVIAQEVGDLAFMNYGILILGILRFVASEAIETTLGTIERARQISHASRFGLVETNAESLRALLSMLQGHAPRFGSLDGDGFDEAAFEARLASNPALGMAALAYWNRKQQARWLAGDHEAALAAGRAAANLLWLSVTVFERSDYHFFDALAHAAALDAAAEADVAGHLQAIRAHSEQLTSWARIGRETFAARAHLVAAELARVEGRFGAALREYDSAIEAARINRLVAEKGMAAECAARFCRDVGAAALAVSYLGKARAAYEAWGATGKVRQLEATHPHLPEIAMSAAPGRVLGADALDQIPVIKAAQSISELMTQDQLVKTLLALVLEQSGARRANLVLMRGEDRVEAVAQVEGASHEGPPPEAVLKYVERTRQLVVLDDARRDAGLFAEDPRLAAGGARSVLCMPILRQSELVGLLYLENELGPGVFTQRRVTALELLASQAAISLENAILLEHEREARRRAERERRSALLLAGATAALVDSEDPLQACRTMASLATQWLADWCVIDAIGLDHPTRIAAAHRQPERAPLLDALAPDVPTRLASQDDGGPATTAPRVFQGPTFEVVAELGVEASQVDLLRSLGAGWLVAAPLVERSRTIGVLILGGSGASPRATAEVQIARDLAQRAALALETARLAVLEDKLRQSQKMEAIGRLASGVAHDFNNLLCVILAYAELLADGLPGDPLQEEVHEIHVAGTRATELTRQLLAFSRQQVLRPRLIDLGEVLQNAEKMLARVLGTSCRLSMTPGQRTRPILADPGQIEQVVMNLVVNARDAMPDGGTVTVEARDIDLDAKYAGEHLGVAPGEFVELSVSDEGSGMDQETKSRIFEPFFTTKQPGKGTGLGLATVFGIVQQTGGHVAVESQLGEGTTFRLLFPACDVEAHTADLAATQPADVAGDETVLLVEDDHQVRRAFCKALQRYGYRVLEAAGPGDALLLSEQHRGPIELLLCDVGLPLMNGIELARRIERQRPDIEILFMSGHTNLAVVERGGVEPHRFLQKPVAAEELARAVRGTLDERRGRAEG